MENILNEEIELALKTLDVNYHDGDIESIAHKYRDEIGQFLVDKIYNNDVIVEHNGEHRLAWKQKDNLCQKMK